MNNELRWKQRFQNFEKAFLLLDGISHKEIDELSQLEQAGVIQCFEIVFELSWKVLKDYLENEGFPNINSPKEVIRQAFTSELITHAEEWMEALEKRNLCSHTYDENILDEIINFIVSKIYPILRDLYQVLKAKI